MRLYSITLFIFLSSFSVFAQAQTLLKGVVSETKVSNDTLDIPYAIYLPVAYDVDKPSKVIFVIDPDGEGIRAARLFVAATHPKNYLIVSNNFSLPKDLDSLDVNATRAIHMMKDVLQKFPVIQNEVYLAGLGEGAQVASAVSYLVNTTNRLLLIDDVYFSNRYADRAGRNLVMGVVGRSSANYYQMSDYFSMLNTFNRNSTLYEYKDEGRWPEASLLRILVNRLSHLNAERYKEELSDSIYSKDYADDLGALKNLISSKEYLTAYDLAKDLKSDYRGHVDLDAIRDVQRSLRKSDVYKKAKRENSKGGVEEIVLLEDIEYFLDEDIALANFENLGYWDERIRQFEAASQNYNKPKEQQVASRILGYIDYRVEDFLTLNRVNLVPQRIFANVLTTILKPNEHKAYLNIISLSAQDRDYNTAYFYLEELLKQGYSDYDALYEIPETELLKIEPTFNELIKSYLGKSKF